MKKTLADIALPQLDQLINAYEQLIASSQYRDRSDISETAANELVIGGIAAIHRIAGSNSPYAVQTADAINKLHPALVGARIIPVGGALKALRQAVAAGYLATIEELIHSNVFDDFLDMAEYLLSEGFKDAAAVMVGGVLEEHLRKLCLKNSIPIEAFDSKGNLRPKMIEGLNTDLVKQSVYSKLEQKAVASWQALRNSAAHGKYEDYDQKQIELMLQGIRDFVIRHSA